MTAAKEHFGTTMGSLAGCQLKGHELGLLGIIRQQEKELVRHRAEDTDLLRAISALQAEMAARIQEAEELGYNRGLNDMRELAEKQLGQKVVI